MFGFKTKRDLASKTKQQNMGRESYTVKNEQTEALISQLVNKEMMTEHLS